jgi:hypothetical protein
LLDSSSSAMGDSSPMSATRWPVPSSGRYFPHSTLCPI